MIEFERVIKKYVNLTTAEDDQFFTGPFLVFELPTDDDFDPKEETIVVNVSDVLGMAATRQAIAGKKVAPLASSQHFVVGRGSDVAIQVFDGTISRQHASLTKSPEGDFILADLGSSNGTMLNGEAVPPMTTRVLQDRDEIIFGVIEATFFHGASFKNLVQAVAKRLKMI